MQFALMIPRPMQSNVLARLVTQTRDLNQRLFALVRIISYDHYLCEIRNIFSVDNLQIVVK